jgi:hypothetical protein
MSRSGLTPLKKTSFLLIAALLESLCPARSARLPVEKDLERRAVRMPNHAPAPNQNIFSLEYQVL